MRPSKRPGILSERFFASYVLSMILSSDLWVRKIRLWNGFDALDYLVNSSCFVVARPREMCSSRFSLVMIESFACRIRHWTFDPVSSATDVLGGNLSGSSWQAVSHRSAHIDDSFDHGDKIRALNPYIVVSHISMCFCIRVNIFPSPNNKTRSIPSTSYGRRSRCRRDWCGSGRSLLCGTLGQVRLTNSLFGSPRYSGRMCPQF